MEEQKSIKNADPILAVQLPVSVQKRSFSLKEPSLQLLGCYAAFLSAHHGKEISEDLVMEGLLDSLRKDKAFKTWAQQNASKANV